MFFVCCTKVGSMPGAEVPDKHLSWLLRYTAYTLPEVTFATILTTDILF